MSQSKGNCVPHASYANISFYIYQDFEKSNTGLVGNYFNANSIKKIKMYISKMTNLLIPSTFSPEPGNALRTTMLTS